MKKVFLFSILATLILSGCNNISGESKYLGSSKSGYELSKLSPIEIVSQESQKALNAQQMLVRYTEQDNATLVIRQENFETHKIAVDYIGKPQSLLNSIAIKYGYRFLELGKKRDLPTVNFSKYYTTPKDLLALVDSQLKGAGKIYLNKEQKIITLDYQEN